MFCKREFFLTVVGACLLGLTALPANADSIALSPGDMVVADGGNLETDLGHVYHVTADGSTATLIGTYNRFCTGVAIDTDGTIIAAGKDMGGLYRIDPSNYNPAAPGTALSISGASFVTTVGVEVGPTGTLYVSGLTSTAEATFRLVNTGDNSYTASEILSSTGQYTDDVAWPIAVKFDGDPAIVWGNRGPAPTNVYEYPDGGVRTKLNLTSVVGNAFSKAYDDAGGALYVGSTLNGYVAKVLVSDGTTTTNIVTGTNPLVAVRGLDFCDGELYAVNSTIDGGVYTIDVTTGAATQLGSASFYIPRDIVVASVPEPSTLILLGGAGLFGFLAYAWRKRK